MSLQSLPPVVMASITLYAGLYQLLIYIYIRRWHSREDLTFALTCLAVSFYDVFCAGLYSAVSPVEGMHWQRAQAIALALISIAFLWFIADYTARMSKRWLYLLSAYFAVAAFVSLVDRSNLTWVADQISIKQVVLPLGVRLTYNEVQPGLSTNIQSMMGLVGLAYILWCSVRLYQSGQPRKASPLLWAMAFFVVGVFNDIAVSVGLYRFVYLIEYAYLAMVLLMAYSLSGQVLEAAAVKQALRASEARWQAIFDNDVAGIGLVDNSGRYIQVNQHWAEMLGYTVEELNRMTNLDVTAQDDAETSHERLQALVRGEIDTYRLEKRFVRKDGSSFWGDLMVAPVRDPDGCVKASFGLILDNSKRKQAEAERDRLLKVLQRNATQLQTAAEVSKSVITILDPEVLMQRTVNLIRERFDFYYVGLFLVDDAGKYAVLRAGTGEAGQHMLKAGHCLAIGGDSMIGWAVAHAQARFAQDTGAEKVRFDNPMLPDTRSELALPLIVRGQAIGALTVQSTQATAFSEEDIAVLQTMADQLAIAIGNARLYAASQQELARRIQAEEALRQLNEELEERVGERTQQLETAKRELEAFAYSVSHDLKAPLRGIDGYSRLLLEDHAGRLDEEGQFFVRTIRQATEQMRQLIDDLLTYSRLERRPFASGRVNPQMLVQAILTERANELHEHKVELVVDVPCDSAIADAEGLSQALRNLIDNAIKFTRNVAQPRIEIVGREMDAMCLVWVRDNGIGFDMQFHDRIFEIFQRLHRAEEYPGTGIGLALVRKAMQRMGGRVWAESAPGAGATFYLEIPR